ncbi:MAG: Hsp33 family molecular chaperone HslO [Burkholderiaceae bacterium]|nr:Hsp33 family molecular chaperone HslO [Burkholderiaceae bacterium]
MTDQLEKYLLSDHSTRVQAVKISSAWQEGLTHQEYPECVQRLLGELVAAAVLLTGNLKFQGSLVLQLQGDGPVALMVVECTTSLAIRATATLREGHAIPADGNLQTLLNTNGQGRFIVVLDPDREAAGLQPYQGVVALEGDSVAQALEDYMRQSEQLDTRLWLAADADNCAGLLLQRLPDAGGIASTYDGERSPEDTWEHVCQLANTVQYEELLTTTSATLVHRLLWEDSVIAFPPQPVIWHCPCTRDRVAGMLRMLGQAEVMDLLDTQDHIDIACNFCGKPYQFDSVDCAGLFIETPAAVISGQDSVH